MFRAIGFVIILWALHSYFAASFTALDSALVSTLQMVEVSATQMQAQLHTAK